MESQLNVKKLLFPTSVVGSMPRSDFVKDLIASAPGEISNEEYESRMDAAVRYIIAVQEQAGLDVVTDGEWRRKSYIGVIAELAHGFELSTNPVDGRPWTIVVDKLSPKEPGFIAREIAFSKSITSRKVKATLPSPALLGERMWDSKKSSGAYPTREEFVSDCVPILRREVELLKEAGADIVQIDDPHLCLFVDPEIRGSYEDPCHASDFAVDVVNGVIEGINGVVFAEHLCRRAGARARSESGHAGGFHPIIDQLNRLKVHHLTMEFTTPGAGDFEVLGQLREDLEIGLGCVDVTPGKIDSPEVIAERVRMAARYIAPERITLNPDCGFAPGSGAVVGIDEAYEKLCNEVSAAAILREEFS
ncbi:MAG: cobalamin-independent methionine synthase II family protein [Verrucomicrobia bacterium]|nr:cobalamin-independent methionine synthase II family protein [Verrucomicrobiota bacterium]